MEISPVCYPIEYLVQKHGPQSQWYLNVGEIEDIEMNEFGLEVDFRAKKEDALDDAVRRDGEAVVIELRGEDGRIICESLLKFDDELETGTLCLQEKR